MITLLRGLLSETVLNFSGCDASSGCLAQNHQQDYLVSLLFRVPVRPPFVVPGPHRCYCSGLGFRISSADFAIAW